jgi:hypothetical protein
MKTLKHVRTEASLHILAHDFKRLVAILGVRPMIAAIRTGGSTATFHTALKSGPFFCELVVTRPVPLMAAPRTHMKRKIYRRSGAVEAQSFVGCMGWVTAWTATHCKTDVLLISESDALACIVQREIDDRGVRTGLSLFSVAAA